MSRRFSLFLIICTVVISMLALSVATVSAQSDGDCAFVEDASDGLVLVDVPAGAAPDGLAIRCNVLAVDGEYNATPGSEGTSRPTRQIPFDYFLALDSVDVFLVGDGSDAVGYGIFSSPVRACFDINDVPGAFVVFTDARNFQGTGSGANQAARTVQVLEQNAAALEDGWACGDITVPGTVTLVTNVPAAADDAANHPLAPIAGPDRCGFFSDGDCIDG